MKNKCLRELKQALDKRIKELDEEIKAGKTDHDRITEFHGLNVFRCQLKGKKNLKERATTVAEAEGD